MQRSIVQIFTNDHLLKMEIDHLKSGRSVCIEIQQYIAQTDWGGRLERRIEEKKQQIRAVVYYDTETHRVLSRELGELLSMEYEFKVDILQYARLIHQTEFESADSCGQLRRLCYEGKLEESAALIDESSLQRIHAQLAEQLRVEENLSRIYDKLVINSLEFIVKAQLTSLDYEVANRFSVVSGYYQKGLISARRAVNNRTYLFNCLNIVASYLQEHNKPLDAKLLYQESLSLAGTFLEEKTAPGALTVKGHVMTNLAAIHRELGEPAEEDRMRNEIEATLQDSLLAILARDAEKHQTGEIDSKMAIESAGIIIQWQRSRISVSKRSKNNPSAYSYIDITHTLGIIDMFRLSFSDQYWIDKIEVTEELGQWHSEYGDASEAEKVYQQCLGMWEQLPAKKGISYNKEQAHIKIRLGTLYIREKEYAKAYAVLLDAIGMCRQLYSTDAEAHSYRLYEACYSLGHLYWHDSRRREAKDCWVEALAGLRMVGAGTLEWRRPQLAQLLADVGFACRDCEQHDQAIGYWEEAVTLMRDEVKRCPEEGYTKLAVMLNDFGLSYHEMRRLPEAEKIFSETLILRRRLAEKAPDEWRPKLSNTLNNISRVYIDTGEWSKAAESLIEAVEIRRQLIRLTPGHWEPKLANNLNDLGVLLYQLGHNKKANEIMREALGLRMKLARANPSLHAEKLMATRQILQHMLGR